jgi:hypothetical protein
MTYAKGSNILATDLNVFIGPNDVSTAYATAAAATGKVAALYGVGFGDRGYGQTTPTLVPVSAGSAIQASKWVELRTALNTMATFQGTATTLLPPASEFVAGSEVKAQVPATTSYNIQAVVDLVDNNRLNANAANMSIVNGSVTSTRTTAWGTAATPSIVSEFRATFASENAARFFFNSGGTLNMSFSHGNTSTPQDSNWNSILSALGTIAIGARGTTRSGSGATPVARGYYDLTTTQQTIFSGSLGSGAYSSNSISITAAVANVAGLNGGNGTSVILRITLTDGHTNAASDSVAATTQVSLGYRKAASVLTGIGAPTFTVNTAF